jgi:hypothetical protein
MSALQSDPEAGALLRWTVFDGRRFNPLTRAKGELRLALTYAEADFHQWYTAAQRNILSK